MTEAPSTAPAKLRVVVLTCGGLGLETARALRNVPGVEVAGVVTAPYPRPPLRTRIRRVYRNRGAGGLLALMASKAGAALGRSWRRAHSPGVPDDLPVIRVDDFHSPAGLERLRALAPDLGVVDGTYILKESVFSLPRLGCINLHCGRVPEYRGSPPAFWELYDGVPEVGVTVHRVSARVDEGAVLLQASFPLDLVPAGDPVAYVRRYWAGVLRPAGIRMLADAVGALAAGTARETPQPPGGATHRTPTRHQLRELRRRVALRRSARRVSLPGGVR